MRDRKTSDNCIEGFMNSNNEEFSKGSIRTSKKRINKRNEVGSERFQTIRKWPNANCVTRGIKLFLFTADKKRI